MKASDPVSKPSDKGVVGFRVSFEKPCAYTWKSPRIYLPGDFGRQAVAFKEKSICLTTPYPNALPGESLVFNTAGTPSM